MYAYVLPGTNVDHVFIPFAPLLPPVHTYIDEPPAPAPPPEQPPPTIVTRALVIPAGHVHVLEPGVLSKYMLENPPTILDVAVVIALSTYPLFTIWVEFDPIA